MRAGLGDGRRPAPGTPISKGWPNRISLGPLAGRIETRTRRLRRALRDHQRAELHRIRAADRRVRGLRLYAAWSCKDTEPMRADEVQNGGVIAHIIGYWGAGEEKSGLKHTFMPQPSRSATFPSDGIRSPAIFARSTVLSG